MKEVIVANDAARVYAANGAGQAIATIDDAVDLAVGSIAVFDETGALIPANATKVDGDLIRFAVRRAKNVKFSQPYYRENFSHFKALYVAPAAKKMALGSNTDAGVTYNLNLPAFADGKTGGVIVINRELPHDNKSREKWYDVPVFTGDTSETFCARLIAKINADAKGIVTVAEVDVTNHDGMIFTAKTAGKDFTINTTGILSGADILEHKAVIQAGTPGVVVGAVAALANLASLTKGMGYPEEVKEIETLASTREGNNRYLTERQNQLYKEPSMVKDDETYNVMVISSTTPNDNKLIARDKLARTLTIAAPVESAAWTAITNIVDVFVKPVPEPVIP